MEITKEGAQSPRMKMRNAEFFFKGTTVIYGLPPFAATDFRTSVKAGKTRLLPLVVLQAQEQAFN